jgi:hypothetical protein
VTRNTYDDFGRQIEDATDQYAGPVKLAVSGEIATRKAVVGSDARLTQSGTSFPGAPVGGQLFARTDLAGDPVYRYDGDAASWVSLSGGGGGGASLAEIRKTVSLRL